METVLLAPAAKRGAGVTPELWPEGGTGHRREFRARPLSPPPTPRLPSSLASADPRPLRSLAWSACRRRRRARRIRRARLSRIRALGRQGTRAARRRRRPEARAAPHPLRDGAHGPG